ncbi:MAG: hypothetical protein ACPKPY_09485 [Nitrososphaeraceae archaeon]
MTHFEDDNNSELETDNDYAKQLHKDVFGHSMYEISDVEKYNGNSKQKNSSDLEKKEEKRKSEILAYKYSKYGQDLLHEAVIINGIPFFVKYNKYFDTVEIIENIEENTRILRPAERQEYPYRPYEFKSKDELEQFIKEAKNITLDKLYSRSKSIFSKYVDQDSHIITLLAADSIWTYFQDLFPTTHYTEFIGTNDVGKSSIGYTFEYTGYRVVKGTAISGANYYRVLGNDEPGQCVIVEDEGDSISEDPIKVKILKSGYEYNGKIPKINMNSRNQNQNWFKTFCYKMILAEKSLRELKAKGLVDRTFTSPCRPGKVRYSIKEVVSENLSKNIKLQELYQELLNFRKLMLCYRLVHYTDELPDIETGLKNRDNELCKPLLQIFYKTDALTEIIDTLKIFVKQRKERKSNSREAVLYPIIKQLIFDKMNTVDFAELYEKNIKRVELFYSDIWKYIIGGGIEGYYNENEKNKYETVDYGTFYNNFLSIQIKDAFGAGISKTKYGSVLIFDVEKLEKFESMYGESELGKDVEIDASDKIEDNNNNGIGDGGDGYEGGDGSRRCVTTSNDDLDTKKYENSFKNKHDFTQKNENFIKENNDTHSRKPSHPSQPSHPSHN